MAVHRRKKVVVGMSGGIDSSAVAALLVDQGYAVEGITLLTWKEREGVDRPWLDRSCCKVGLAKHVARKLGIPHRVVEAQQAFRDLVIADFLSEYDAGRTPNPCVRCNEKVKFGLLLRIALDSGADYLATGHYARVAFCSDTGRYSLLRGVDRGKDQSYFLYRLNQSQLSRVMFPLGDIRKAQVWRMAERLDLPADEVAESQEICFVSEGDYRQFLLEQMPGAVREGKIVSEDGKTVGRHQGVSFYTIGQRKGLGLGPQASAKSARLYVTALDPAHNRVTIGPEASLYQREVIVGRLNLIRGDMFRSGEPVRVTAKIRYRSIESEAVARWAEGGCLSLGFEAPQRAVTPGQSLVMYRGDEVLGGGVIQAAHPHFP